MAPEGSDWWKDGDIPEEDDEEPTEDRAEEELAEAVDIIIIECKNVFVIL